MFYFINKIFVTTCTQKYINNLTRNVITRTNYDKLFITPSCQK